MTITPATESKNRSLHAAKAAKKDEFYTQREDIEYELRHYRKHFAGKVVYLNCDDPYESHFFKHFAVNFEALGLRKLIATCYSGSSVAGEQLSFDEVTASTDGAQRRAYKVEITHIPDANGDGAIDLSDVDHLLRNDKNVLTLLNEGGDFRSPEAVALLREADIVVTNPPFSLFREYVAQLVAHDKQFLIVGHQNAITYKEIFPLIKDGQLWLGYGFRGSVAHFRSPYQDVATSSDHREGMVRVSGVCWFTNMDFPKRHEALDLHRKYYPENGGDPAEFPKFDNYDAINVNKTADIPMDYYGAIGVPITFLSKWNPEQFEILHCDTVRSNGVRSKAHGLIKDKEAAINGKPTYVRIAIRRKK